MGGRPAERTIQTMELAQIYEMLNGVEGGADAPARTGADKKYKKYA